MLPNGNIYGNIADVWLIQIAAEASLNPGNSCEEHDFRLCPQFLVSQGSEDQIKTDFKHVNLTFNTFKMSYMVESTFQ